MNASAGNPRSQVAAGRSPLRVFPLTAPGRGAVASLRLVGADLRSKLSSLLFLSPNHPLRTDPGALRLARWRTAQGEEVVVDCRAEDVFELHCHGGYAAVEAIVADLRAAGFMVYRPDEADFETTDPIRRSALRAVICAPTVRTAAILHQQAAGALRQALEEIEQAVARNAIADARERIAALGATAAFGLHLTRPWRVVVAGRPNVGKSSLVNALLGYGRALVCDLPGTTRDTVTSQTAVDGWPIELIDTAGLRETADALEREGVARAGAARQHADLVLLVGECHRSLEADERAWFADWPERLGNRVLTVGNKCDLAPGPATSPKNALADNGYWSVLVSARTGRGIADLVAAIAARLAPIVPEISRGVLFTADQAARLAEIDEAVSRGEVRNAAQALAQWLAHADVA